MACGVTITMNPMENDPSKRHLLAKALLGSGLAKAAGTDMRLYPSYQRYAIDTQSNGEEPLPFEQWKQSQMPPDQQAR